MRKKGSRIRVPIEATGREEFWKKGSSLQKKKSTENREGIDKESTGNRFLMTSLLQYQTLPSRKKGSRIQVSIEATGREKSSKKGSSDREEQVDTESTGNRRGVDGKSISRSSIAPIPNTTIEKKW